MNKNAAIRYFNEALDLKETKISYADDGLVIEGQSPYRTPSLAHIINVLPNDDNATVKLSTCGCSLPGLRDYGYIDDEFLEKAVLLANNIGYCRDKQRNRLDYHVRSTTAFTLKGFSHQLAKASSGDEETAKLESEFSERLLKYTLHVNAIPEQIDLADRIRIKRTPFKIDSKHPSEATCILDAEIEFPSDYSDQKGQPLIEKAFTPDMIKRMELGFGDTRILYDASDQLADNQHNLYAITVGQDFESDKIGGIIEKLFFGEE